MAKDPKYFKQRGTRLGTYDENLNRIVIMVRGKMAKEDVFSEIGTTALYSKYIFYTS